MQTFILQLNPITANAESVVPVAYSHNRDHLVSLYKKLRVEYYTEGRYHKGFRKDSILEMFNPVNEGMDGHPIGEPWMGIPYINVYDPALEFLITLAGYEQYTNEQISAVQISDIAKLVLTHLRHTTSTTTFVNEAYLASL
jgi:hypothetical protein